MSTSRTQQRRHDSINPDGEDGRIGDEVISPPASTGGAGVLAGEPNAEVLPIEIDVDYTKNDVETDIFGMKKLDV
jgi:hypothetical protein